MLSPLLIRRWLLANKEAVLLDHRVVLGEAHLAHEGPRRLRFRAQEARSRKYDKWDREPGPGSMTSEIGSQVLKV